MLEYRRVAEIFAERQAGKIRLGSGYLVGGRLVLTAAHVVEVGPVRVRLLEDGRLLSGRIVWSRRDDAVDAALVEIDDPAWTWRAPSVRWGRLTGLSSVRCEALGFPEAQHGDVRDTEHLRGAINPGTLKKAGRYDILVDSPPAARAGLWKGISGAAVFVKGVLCGVIALDPPAFASRRLTAVPVEAFTRDQGFVAVAGVCELESAELAAVFESPWSADELVSPAFLLRASAQVVPFHGRSETMAELREWCDGPTAFSARLVHGPGGQGKTRLAGELATHLRQAGWATGWLRPSSEIGRLAEVTAPTLVIVDYAETRPDELGQLLAVVAQARRTGLRLRTLLLARSAGAWWDQLIGASPASRQLLYGTPAIALPPLEESPDSRATGFRTAVRSFAPALARVPGLGEIDWGALGDAVRPPRNLAHGRYGSVLALHMAALAALLRAAPTPVSADTDEDVLLAHEEKYWTDTATARSLGLAHRQTLKRAVTVACIVSPATEAEAEELLATVPGLRDQPEDRRAAVAEWLHDLYPASDGRYWGRLQPDRLGERLIGLVTKQRPDLLNGLLVGAAADRAQEALGALGRAAERHPSAADAIARLVAAQPETLGPDAIAAATRAEHPRPLVLAVQPLSKSLADRPEVLAQLLHHASLAPALFGDWCVKASRAVIEGYRRLAGTDPAAYTSKLAWELYHQAQRLAKVGDFPQALRPATEALSIWRDLGDDGEGLAAALGILAVIHDETGESSQAAVNAKDAVSVWERVVGEDPDADVMGLVEALNNLAAILGLRHPQESMQAAQRAVEVYGRARDPDPQLSIISSSAAMTLANRLHDLGLQEEAFAGYEEVIDFRRRLAESFPNLFDGELASALHNYAKALLRTSQRAKALALTEEAISIYRGLSAALPQAYQDKLAATLSAKGLICTFAEPPQVRAAIEAFREVVRLTGDELTITAAHQGLALLQGRAPREFNQAWQEITGLPPGRVIPPGWFGRS